MTNTGRLGALNAASPEQAAADLGACNASPRWIAQVVARRPYADAEALLRTAEDTARALPWDEVRAALEAHPRIGDRAQGQSTEARWSRREQASVGSSDRATTDALRAGNAAYERRFGHVFLIRAAERSAEEMLAELRRRLDNDEAGERVEVTEQLAQITRLRLSTLLADRHTEEPTMAVTLGHNQYGKAETRVVRVFRDTEPHEIADYNVSVALSGDFADVHLTGDNTKCLTTDATKNTVNSYAKEAGDAVRQPESFGMALATHFVDDVPQVDRVRIQIEAYPWDRLSCDGAPHPHAFSRRGAYVRTVTVTYDGTDLWVVSGVRDLVVLKTTDSEFHTFYEERYTTLQPTTDRIMATSVTAQWLHTDPRMSEGSTPSGGGSSVTNAVADWGTSYDRVLATLGSTFAGHHSLALQQTMYAIGENILTEQPEIAEIRFSMPNKHHFVVDLSPFGVKNENEVFHADDRPYGYIEGTVRRDDAPNPGPAAFDPGQGW